MLIQIGYKKLTSTGEHKITVMKDGQYSEDASYYSDDLLDALGSGSHIGNDYVDAGHKVIYTKAFKAKLDEALNDGLSGTITLPSQDINEMSPEARDAHLVRHLGRDIATSIQTGGQELDEMSPKAREEEDFRSKERY